MKIYHSRQACRPIHTPPWKPAPLLTTFSLQTVDDNDLVFKNKKNCQELDPCNCPANCLFHVVVVVLKISTTYDFTQDHISVGA